MQATEMVFPAIGEPETIEPRTRELPAPGSGQVVVAVEATGVSFAEQQMRRGRYFEQPAFPFVPGYDLVGRVLAAGPGVDLAAGTRVAALTKTGGWADRVLLDAADLTPVPEGVDAAAAETVIVNGLTALRMLTWSRARAGQTVVVLGASGGVGSTLVQLARARGMRVIGTAGARSLVRVRELGAEPVDRTGDVTAAVRRLAPEGVAAVFDNVGTDVGGLWRTLTRGGALVVYGTAATASGGSNQRLGIFALAGRLALWHVLPNGKRATFFNIWAGRRNPDRFRAGLRRDLTELFGLLADGTLEPRIAAEFPLEEAATAMRTAEAGGLVGKVILKP